MSSSTKKTSTITFRLDENTIEGLRNESSNRKVSTNTLVNQALRQFLDWGMYESTVGFVMINKQVFVHVFGKLSQKEIIDVITWLRLRHHPGHSERRRGRAGSERRAAVHPGDRLEHQDGARYQEHDRQRLPEACFIERP